MGQSKQHVSVAHNRPLEAATLMTASHLLAPCLPFPLHQQTNSVTPWTRVVLQGRWLELSLTIPYLTGLSAAYWVSSIRTNTLDTRASLVFLIS